MENKKHTNWIKITTMIATIITAIATTTLLILALIPKPVESEPSGWNETTENKEYYTNGYGIDEATSWNKSTFIIDFDDTKNSYINHKGSNFPTDVYDIWWFYNGEILEAMAYHDGDNPVRENIFWFPYEELSFQDTTANFEITWVKL